MTQALFESLALSLLATLVLEAGFFLLVGKRERKDLLLTCMVNVLTNPVVVLAYWLTVLYTTWNAAIMIVILEMSAVFVEGYCYRQYGRCFKHPYLFSLAANLFSFFSGFVIQWLI